MANEIPSYDPKNPEHQQIAEEAARALKPMERGLQNIQEMCHGLNDMENPHHRMLAQTWIWKGQFESRVERLMKTL